MNKDNLIQDLKDKYQKYKQKEYHFGCYETKDQLREAFIKGKIFVIKGGLRLGDWILMVILILWAIVVLVISLSFLLIILAISLFCFWMFLGLILLVKLRMVIVISSQGVYYQRTLSKGFFLWDSVADVRWKILTTEYTTSMRVVIYFFHGEKIKFGSGPFILKEFPKKIKKEMFFNVFKIGFDLRRNQNL
ncbi:MAG: hypothetical protein ACFE9Z_08105 [Promethearchaeota archaeon]